MSTVRVYSENGEQKLDSFNKALKDLGCIFYEFNGVKYVSGNGEKLTDKQYKESKVTDAEMISDAVSEKMDQVAEIYKNLNRIYNFGKREAENIPFYSREGEIIATLKEKPGYYREGKKNYFSKEIIEDFQNDRKARVEAVNKIMGIGSKEENTMNNVALLAYINEDRETEMSMETLEKFIGKRANVFDDAGMSDKKAYVNEGRKASIIKKAYDTVMSSGRDIDKQEAQKMMDIYLAALMMKKC